MDKLMFDCVQLSAQASRLHEAADGIARIADDIDEILATINCSLQDAAAIRTAAGEYSADAAGLASAIGRYGDMLEEIAKIYNLAEQKSLQACLELPRSLEEALSITLGKTVLDYASGAYLPGETASMISSDTVVEPWLMKLIFDSQKGLK